MVCTLVGTCIDAVREQEVMVTEDPNAYLECSKAVDSPLGLLLTDHVQLPIPQLIYHYSPLHTATGSL